MDRPTGDNKRVRITAYGVHFATPSNLMCRIRNGERGAAAAILAVTATALFAVAALSIDLGNAWQRQRSLQTAVDAAALASAHSYAHGEAGCTAVAGEYVERNDPGAKLGACLPSGSDRFGWVTVRASVTVPYLFGGVLGIDQAEITSESSALWGSPIDEAYPADSPLTLCFASLATDPAFTAWQATGGKSDTVRIPLADTPCGAPAREGPALRSALQAEVTATAPLLVPILDADGTSAGIAAVQVQRVNVNAATGEVDSVDVTFVASLSDAACCAEPADSLPDFHRRATRLVSLDADGLPIRR